MEAPLPALVARLRLRARGASQGSEIAGLYDEVLGAAEEAAARLEGACDILGCHSIVEAFKREASRLLGLVEEDPYSAYDSVKEFAERLIFESAARRYQALAVEALAGGGALAVALPALAVASSAGSPASLLLGLTGAILALAAAMLAAYSVSPLLTIAGAALALAGTPGPLYGALIGGGAVLAVLSMLYKRSTRPAGIRRPSVGSQPPPRPP